MSISDKIDALPPLRDVVSAHGLTANKIFGQNYLFDLNLTRRIARAAQPVDTIIEIGPRSGRPDARAASGNQCEDHRH
jgi:16S rRNA (adenine1518-N6/adenine1519-N6)-dimethyltransferase